MKKCRTERVIKGEQWRERIKERENKKRGH